jgi:hypothetical protein
MRLSHLVAALLALTLPTCNQAIMTAPPGSEMTMFINPDIISSNGGVAVVSVLIMEATGTVVADGTVVQFFTTLGMIDEQGKTNDGVARVNLRANGRSGVADITAVSGGGAAPPTPTTTTTTTLVSSRNVTGGSGGADAAGSVTIGNFGAASVLVTADPSRLTTSRSSQVTATVFDSDGNPLPGVPVYFSVSVGGETNFVESGGRPKFTDSNGQAFDVFRTRNTLQGEATVLAQAPVGGGTFISDTIVIEIR